MTMKPLMIGTLMACVLQAASAEIIPLNGIAGEVNSHVITYGDIDRQVRLLKYNNPNNADIDEQQILQVARQRVLERALLIDAAREQGLSASTAEVDAEINRRAQAGGVSVETLYADANKMGWNKGQYRLEVAKDLIIERLNTSVSEGIQISDEQINRYIQEAQQSGARLPVGEPYTVYTVRRIVLLIDQNSTRDALGKQAQLLADAIAQGNDFGAVARRYSQDVSAQNGGLVEVSDEMLPEKVDAVLKKLQDGQMSMPIQTAQTWQIIQLVNKRTENNPEKMQREAVRREMVQKAQQQAYEQFISQLQQNAVVRQY